MGAASFSFALKATTTREMPPLRFGLGLPNAFPLGEPNLDFVRFAERAEELGYDALWAGDHIVFHIPRYEIFTTLATVAARTRRVTIGPGVLLLCLRNPVHVAQAIATLDQLSQGRFVFGVGVGGEHPKEFLASGVAKSERGARTDEALDVIRRLLTEPAIDHAGRFWNLPGIAMTLKPRRRIPVWIGGRVEATFRRVVQHGDAWFPGFVTADRFRAGAARIDELCREAGRDPHSIERALYLFVNVDHDESRARRSVEEFLSRNYAMPAKPFAPYFVAGTPAQCIDAVRDYVAAGPRHLTFRFASADPLGQLEQWTREVMPALRESA